MKWKRILGVAAALCLLTLVVHSQTDRPAAEWPQWRGPERTGRSSETGLLKQWPEGGPKKIWTITGLGAGFSSITVKDGRIFTMGNSGEGQADFALDFKTGKKLWTSVVNSRNYTNKRGNGPRGSPTVDGEFVYTEGGYGTVSCCEAATGKRTWQVSLPGDMGGTQPGWGYSESPLIVGRAVIVTPGGRQGAIAALDKKTGRVIWRSTEVRAGASYCSAVIVTVDGKKQILNGLSKRVVGVDADTGKPLWEFREPASEVCAASPIVHQGLVFVSSSYGKGGGAARITARGAEKVWHDKKIGNHHGGVVRVGDYVYGFFDGMGRNLCCVEMKTGRVAWKDRSVGKGSLVYADGYLYCLGEGGTVGLVEATPDGYREKGRFRLPRGGKGRSWAHPVVVGGRLFVRHGDCLHCWDVKAK